MNNMGQLPADQWGPPWGPIKVYDKDNLGIECTMIESYFDSMYTAKSNKVEPKITLDNLMQCNNSSLNSKEKSGFEPDAPVTPPINNLISSVKLSDAKNYEIDLNGKSCSSMEQCNPKSLFTGSGCAIKEEPLGDLSDTQTTTAGFTPSGWGSHPSSMHFDSLKVVSEHLVERFKLEESVFRDVFQSGASFPMCAAPTPTTSSFTNPWGISPQCNLNTFSSYVNDTATNHGSNSDSQNKNKTFPISNKDHNPSAFVQATNNFNRSMNNNFMCTTMFLMNDSLQQNSTHQAHNNTKKHHEVFNIACEKGCNCEATNSLFRAGGSQMFSAEKHAAAAAAAAKHFMAPCGPLQLTAQECSEFLLKKVAVPNSLVSSDGSLLGVQNNSSSTNTPQQKNRQTGTTVDNAQQTNSSTTVKVANASTNTGQKYRVAKERPFSCQECGKSFLLKHHLVTHARVHTGERPHVCPECGKSFAHKHCLSTHLLLHSSQRPYQCPECKKSFTLKHHLVTHARVHSRDRPFVCRECGRTFPQKRHLATHAKFHSGERPHVCEECGESFSKEDHLIIHSRFHGGQHPYACPDCGSTFARKFELVNHGRLHGRIPHSCDVCGKEFLQKRTLLAHARLHVEGERPFVCQQCGETFQRKSELIEHSHLHADDKSFVCRECGDCFPNREALALHYRLHASDHNFVADLCGLAAAFQQPAAHFLCPTPLHPPSMGKINQNSAGSSTSASGSVQSSHQQPKPKPHVCPDCGKCFAQKHGLAQHNRRHSGGSCDVRQHVCDKCGKAFFQKNHLRVTSKAAHGSTRD
ncbi:hypothetical protein L9F63_020449 [Diploptera punctata]|uniref:C2H2-type domain-containing protein n=1 Tax=Diploptera punctata TaxID=6984 RepID=A0AAD7ZSP2_DIPPU|nr:hypothetical protein L9F63_020449 [Diploptera punctata]